MDPITATIVAVFQAAATAWASVGQIGQFIISTLVSAALSGSKIPGLSDLKVQTASYGKGISKLFGLSVRVAGNVIDKSDLIAFKHKKGAIAGVGGVKYYTYDVHLQILICDGVAIKPNGLKRIFANGKVVFDRDATGATAGTVLANGGLEFTKLNKTQVGVKSVRLYRGEATQGVDPTIQALPANVGMNLPAYRGVTTVVFEYFPLADYGNRVPNFEFEVEPMVTELEDVVEALGRAASVEIDAFALRGTTVRGYALGTDCSTWDAIKPLGAAYAFDLSMRGPGFRAIKRGGLMRTIIPEGEYGADQVGSRPTTTKTAKLPTTSKLPEAILLNYLAASRDYQPSTQRAGRNETRSENVISIDVPLVMTDDEARNLAQRSLYESAARQQPLDLSLSARYRWLESGDLVGLTVAGNVWPFRLGTLTQSPNGVIQVESAFEDSILYEGNLVGNSGVFSSGVLELPGDTIMQPIDAHITNNLDDDTGFTAAFAGTGIGWRGAIVYRALGVGSPLSFEELGNVGLAATMANATTTLAAGPTHVFDRVNTLTVTLIGDDGVLTAASEDDVLVKRANLAWLGPTSGQGGEYIQFSTVTPSGGSFILGGLLRGLYGTEARVGSHGSGERLVMMTDRDALYRINTTPDNWNVAYTYRADSVPDSLPGATQVVTNSGRGKSPLSPTHVRGDRDGSNNTVISWVRRTRMETPALGGGATPLGEDYEQYAIDIYKSGVVIRSEIVTSPTYTYTAANATADGNTPGAAVRCDVYQVSSIFGRGDVAAVTV